MDGENFPAGDDGMDFDPRNLPVIGSSGANSASPADDGIEDAEFTEVDDDAPASTAPRANQLIKVGGNADGTRTGFSMSDLPVGPYDPSNLPVIRRTSEVGHPIGALRAPLGNTTFDGGTLFGQRVPENFETDKENPEDAAKARHQFIDPKAFNVRYTPEDWREMYENGFKGMFGTPVYNDGAREQSKTNVETGRQGGQTNNFAQLGLLSLAAMGIANPVVGAALAVIALVAAVAIAVALTKMRANNNVAHDVQPLPEDKNQCHVEGISFERGKGGEFMCNLNFHNAGEKPIDILMVDDSALNSENPTQLDPAMVRYTLQPGEKASIPLGGMDSNKSIPDLLKKIQAKTDPNGDPDIRGLGIQVGQTNANGEYERTGNDFRLREISMSILKGYGWHQQSAQEVVQEKRLASAAQQAAPAAAAPETPSMFGNSGNQGGGMNLGNMAMAAAVLGR